MNPETMLAWLQAKQGRHRLTIPNHIKKALDRLLSKEAEDHRKAKKKAKRKKPALQAQSESDKLISKHKKVQAGLRYATGVALANGWRGRADGIHGVRPHGILQTTEKQVCIPSRG